MNGSAPNTPFKPPRRIQSFSMTPLQLTPKLFNSNHSKDSNSNVDSQRDNHKFTAESQVKLNRPVSSQNEVTKKFKTFKKSHELIAELKINRAVSNSSRNSACQSSKDCPTENRRQKMLITSEIFGGFDSFNDKNGSLINVERHDADTKKVSSKNLGGLLEENWRNTQKAKGNSEFGMSSSMTYEYTGLQADSLRVSNPGQKKQPLPKYIPKRFQSRNILGRQSMLDQKGIEENYSHLQRQDVFEPPIEAKSTKIHQTASTISSELQHYQSVKTLKDFDDLEASQKSIKIEQNLDENSNSHKPHPRQRKQTKVSLERVEEEPQSGLLQDEVNNLFSDQEESAQENYNEELEKEFSEIF